MTDLLSRAQLLRLKKLKEKIERITYKAPNFGAASGEVISGQLGRGEGGRFANIDEIRRASQAEDPLSVFQGSKRRMFQTFYNAFTRETPFTKDLDASQKKVADLLASKNGNWDDEVKQAQQASDELWQLDTSYRRHMLTGDTGLKPGGISVKIEGFNSDKTGDGQTVAEMIQANTGEPADSFSKGIGQRMVQDAYNYLSMFNQRSELKGLNGDVPEFNLTRLPDGQKYKINEEELAKGNIKIDFNYDPKQPQGPSKDDITAAMSDIMMKLDPEIVKYAESFSSVEPNFAIGKDGMPKDLLQQAMASLVADPQKMALENPNLFKFALSAVQGVNLFEGDGGAVTGTPAPQPAKVDPSKYPGNDVEPGLEQDRSARGPATPAPTPAPAPKPTYPTPDYINQPRFDADPTSQALNWYQSQNRYAPTESAFPPGIKPPPGFVYAGMVQGPTGQYGASAIDPLAPWVNPQTGESWRADPEAVRKWREESARRRTNAEQGTAGNSTQTATQPPTPTPGPTVTPTGTPTGTPTAVANTSTRTPTGTTTPAGQSFGPPPPPTGTPSGTRTSTGTPTPTRTSSGSSATRATDPKDQPLYDRAAKVIQGIPQNQRQFLMRDITNNPKLAAQKYGISENDALMLAGYYRKVGG